MSDLLKAEELTFIAFTLTISWMIMFPLLKCLNGQALILPMR